MAPHATQAWQQEREMLDKLLTSTPGARRLIAEKLWNDILGLFEFTARWSASRTPRPFSAVIERYPRRMAREPSGAMLQGLAYGYLMADAPNVILGTDRVRAGSRRAGRVGDVDGWRGSTLVLTVEVKDARLDLVDLSMLDGFIRNLSEYPDATAIVLADAFTESMRTHLESLGLLTLDPNMMARTVALWDVPKQMVAVDAVRYFLWTIQRNQDMLVRFETFLAEVVGIVAYLSAVRDDELRQPGE